MFKPFTISFLSSYKMTAFTPPVLTNDGLTPYPNLALVEACFVNMIKEVKFQLKIIRFSNSNVQPIIFGIWHK